MKKELKGFICGVLTTALLTCTLTFAAGQWKTIDVLENDITVIVDGKQVTESNFVYNDRTYLPLRAVAEAVNKPVEYDEETNTAYIGEVPEKPDTTEQTATQCYENCVGVPDFGKLYGVSPVNIETSTDSTGNVIKNYYYDFDACSDYLVEYIDVLYGEGYIVQEMANDAPHTLYSAVDLTTFVKTPVLFGFANDIESLKLYVIISLTEEK